MGVRSELHRTSCVHRSFYGQDCSIRSPCELGSGLARLQIGVNTEVLPTLMLLRILSSSAHKVRPPSAVDFRNGLALVVAQRDRVYAPRDRGWTRYLQFSKLA